MERRKIAEVLKDCRRHGTAIPAFNYSDMWDLKAIIAAASAKSISIIVASNPFVATGLGPVLCENMVQALRCDAKIGVYHHLDHSLSSELCAAAVEAGYDSVMIDGSSQDLMGNIGLVREVIEYARARGVCVEAEIGRIRGMGVEGRYNGDDYLARVDDVVELVEKTGVNSLAVGIGTAHGFYEGAPQLNFERLDEIAAAVHIPLVLHGGTGLADSDIRRCIRSGISKVNIGTIIHTTYMNALRDTLNDAGERPYTLDVMEEVLPAVEDVVSNRIDAVVLAQ